MDYDRIEQILNRYWECETTLEEERELKAFFQRNDIPERWKKEAALFGFFKQEREEGNLGEFFDHRVMEQVNEMEGRKSGQAKGRTVRMWQDISKVAGVVLILVTAVFVARDQYLQTSPDDPIEAEARQAYEQTKAALLMLSKSMNKGTEQVGKMAIFNEAQQIVREDVVTEKPSEEKNNEEKQEDIN